MVDRGGSASRMPSSQPSPTGRRSKNQEPQPLQKPLNSAEKGIKKHDPAGSHLTPMHRPELPSQTFPHQNGYSLSIADSLRLW